jgi:hypothetical protein
VVAPSGRHGLASEIAVAPYPGLLKIYIDIAEVLIFGAVGEPVDAALGCTHASGTCKVIRASSYAGCQVLLALSL